MKISQNSVGMAVRAARQAARLSLSDIFEITNISVSALSRIENGVRSLDFLEASAIADVLKVDLEHFRALAVTFEEEGLVNQISNKREALADLRAIQRLAILTAIEASGENALAAD